MPLVETPCFKLMVAQFNSLHSVSLLSQGQVVVARPGPNGVMIKQLTEVILPGTNERTRIILRVTYQCAVAGNARFPL